ncbi:MAG: nitroreductase [Erysipelotrichaceae bacterium]|nr:nitroreductase [Erysipelotrichaceae bacterium]
MKNFFEVVDNRSSIRKFTDQPLSDELIRQLAEAGLKAPTATNKQEIHISVVRNDNPVQEEIRNDLNPDAPVSFFYNAPVTFYISADESFRWSPVDAGICVENIHLAADALGLGSVILGSMEKVLNGEKKQSYAEKLAFPQGYKYYIAVAIGYPDTEKKQHDINYERDVTVL